MNRDSNDDSLEGETSLQEILNQETETAAVLARVDERTKRTNEILERVIENRVAPLESQVEKVDNRSRRNMLILSAILTATLAIGTWALDLIPVAT